MMNKEQKQKYITEMTSQFENSKAIMVTHYQGLTMPQLDELRSKMREHGIIFRITKKQAEEIAKQKMNDLNAIDLEQAVKIIAGSARSMGIEVKE